MLKNLDQDTAKLFSKLCSACTFLDPNEKKFSDARVPLLGGNAASISLIKYGLNYAALNILNEHGLIISDYNSWCDYRRAIGTLIDNTFLFRMPFSFQNRYWVLVPAGPHALSKEFKLHGVALTESGKELSKIVELEPMEEFVSDLMNFFRGKKLQMTEVDSSQPQ